jgi:Ca2+-binding RTX toxin-like protein
MRLRLLSGGVIIAAALVFPAESVRASNAAPTCNGVRATMVGDNSSQVLQGTNGRDVILAMGGDDTVFGNGGDDVVCGGPGIDHFTGGPGDDSFISDGDLGTPVSDGADTIIGGPGHDRVTYRFRHYGVEVNLTTPGGDGYAGENDNIHPDIEEIEGSQGPDRMAGTDGASQTLRGSGGSDMLWGGDTLTGTANDIIYGDDDNDMLIGSGGNDRLYGGLGSDRLWGVGGHDSFGEPATPNDGADIISGGSDRDCVDYTARTEGVYITMDGQPNDGDVDGSAEPLLVSRENDNVMTDVECVRGSGFRDFLDGSAYPASPGEDGVTIVGWHGPDRITGSSGNDRITGDTVFNGPRQGSDDGDHLSGGPGDDHVIGGFGDDEIIGGSGADRLDGTDGVAANDEVDGSFDSDSDVCFGDFNDTVSRCP